MSTKEQSAALAHSCGRLMEQWHDTRAYWQDARSAAFERDYLAALPDRINKAGMLLEELDAMLAKIRSACE